MTKVKHLQDGWKERESNIEDYVTNTLMTTMIYGRAEQAEERIEAITKAFGELIKHLHANNQLKLPDIEDILTTYESLTYKED